MKSLREMLGSRNRKSKRRKNNSEQRVAYRNDVVYIHLEEGEERFCIYFEGASNDSGLYHKRRAEARGEDAGPFCPDYFKGCVDIAYVKELPEWTKEKAMAEWIAESQERARSGRGKL
jgi:hypothetical protein